jgi:hypothetical protein
VHIANLAGALGPLVVGDFFAEKDAPQSGVVSHVIGLAEAFFGLIACATAEGKELHGVHGTTPMPTPEHQDGTQHPCPPLAALAVGRNNVFGVAAQPARGFFTELDNLTHEGRPVVLEGDTLDLVEEHLGVIVSDDAVGASVGVAEVEDEELSVVLQGEEAGDDVDVISVRRVLSKAGRRHGDDACGDVRQIQIESQLRVPIHTCIHIHTYKPTCMQACIHHVCKKI